MHFLICLQEAELFGLYNKAMDILATGDSKDAKAAFQMVLDHAVIKQVSLYRFHSRNQSMPQIYVQTFSLDALSTHALPMTCIVFVFSWMNDMKRTSPAQSGIY